MITSEILKIVTIVLAAGLIGCGTAIYTLNISNSRLEEKLGQSKAAEEILKRNEVMLLEAITTQNAAVKTLKSATIEQERRLAAAQVESLKIRRESATTIAQLRAKDVAKLTCAESTDLLLESALRRKR